MKEEVPSSARLSADQSSAFQMNNIVNANAVDSHESIGEGATSTKYFSCRWFARRTGLTPHEFFGWNCSTAATCRLQPIHCTVFSPHRALWMTSFPPHVHSLRPSVLEAAPGGHRLVHFHRGRVLFFSYHPQDARFLTGDPLHAPTNRFLATPFLHRPGNEHEKEARPDSRPLSPHAPFPFPHCPSHGAPAGPYTLDETRGCTDTRTRHCSLGSASLRLAPPHLGRPKASDTSHSRYSLSLEGYHDGSLQRARKEKASHGRAHDLETIDVEVYPATRGGGVPMRVVLGHCPPHPPFRAGVSRTTLDDGAYLNDLPPPSSSSFHRRRWPVPSPVIIAFA